MFRLETNGFFLKKKLFNFNLLKVYKLTSHFPTYSASPSQNFINFCHDRGEILDLEVVFISWWCGEIPHDVHIDTISDTNCDQSDVPIPDLLYCGIKLSLVVWVWFTISDQQDDIWGIWPVTFSCCESTV